MSNETVDHAPFYDTANRVSRSVVAVIDTITQRGGFKGEELSTIGQLRDQCIQLIQQADSFQRVEAESK
jgi:hypothetical protein